MTPYSFLSVKFAVKMAIKSINAQIPDTNVLEIVRVRNSITIPIPTLPTIKK